jgi:hypothetical protein
MKLRRYGDEFLVLFIINALRVWLALACVA